MMSFYRAAPIILLASAVCFGLFNNCGEFSPGQRLPASSDAPGSVESSNVITVSYPGSDGTIKYQDVTFEEVDGHVVINGDVAVGEVGEVAAGDLVPLNLGSNSLLASQESDVAASSVKRNRSRLWPNGRVPYATDKIPSAANRVRLEEKIASFNALMESNDINVTLVPRQNEVGYLDFVDSTRRGFCGWSYLGYYGAPQDVGIHRSCFGGRTIHHEILHALGIGHEHSRPDRDQYVTIEIDEDHVAYSAYNSKYDEADISNHSQYDINSIMHYRFGSIIKLRPEYADQYIGNESLSALDLAGLKSIYSIADDLGYTNPQAMPMPTKVRFMRLYNVMQRSLSIEWGASVSSAEIRGYKIRRNGTFVFETSDRSFDDIGLQPGSQYIYQVIPVSNSGLEGMPVERVGRTVAAAPVGGGTGNQNGSSAPEVPSIVDIRSAVYSSTAAEVFWGVDGESGDVKAYNIFVNGSLEKQVPGKSAYLSGLPSGTSIRVEVQAETFRGEKSPRVSVVFNLNESNGGGGTAPGVPTSLAEGKYSFQDTTFYIFNNGKNCEYPRDEPLGEVVDEAVFMALIQGKTERSCR